MTRQSYLTIQLHGSLDVAIVIHSSNSIVRSISARCIARARRTRSSAYETPEPPETRRMVSYSSPRYF